MTRKEYNLVLKECLKNRCFDCGAKNSCERIKNALGEVWHEKLAWASLTDEQRKRIGAT